MLRKLSLGLIVALAACGTARVIQRTQTGGIIELQGDRGKAMEQANQEMASHCGPNNYTIVQEGEEAVGTDTYSQSNTQYGQGTSTSPDGQQQVTQGGQQTNQVQSTRTATAWRVHYACNGAGGAPPPAGMPPGGAPPPPAPPPGGAPPPPAPGAPQY
ncbi:MAG: hypothetical protein ACM31C_05240 [Acidobacteriota bacterium]